MRRFETQFQRLELKYVVGELAAARVRRAIEPYCRPDRRDAPPYASGLPSPRGYAVESEYLDTPSLAFHRAKQRGDPERLKLRVRSYAPAGPAYLEIKRRFGDVIAKTRVAVARDSVEEAVLGFGKPLEESPEARRIWERFSGLVAGSGAGPTLRVRYAREAYTSTVDVYARVTFDRRIAAQRIRSWDDAGAPDLWCEVEDSLSERAPWPLVVVEFKCRSLVPHWMSEVIRHQGLQRQSFSKYSIGIFLTGRRDGAWPLAQRCGGVLS